MSTTPIARTPNRLFECGVALAENQASRTMVLAGQSEVNVAATVNVPRRTVSR